MTDWLGRDWLGLAGRAALVAGAGGIGEAAALALARAGARVAVTDVSEPRLAGLARAAGAESLDIRTVAADLASAGAARQAVGEAAALLGGLDVFVHAVGVNDRRPVLDTPDEVWERIIDVNLKSAVGHRQRGRARLHRDRADPRPPGQAGRPREPDRAGARRAFVTGHVIYVDGGRTLV